jgi:hypothetical protein
VVVDLADRLSVFGNGPAQTNLGLLRRRHGC